MDSQNQRSGSFSPLHFIVIGTAAAKFLVKNKASLPFDSFTIIDKSKPESLGDDVRFIEYLPTSFGMSLYFSKRKMSNELKEFIDSLVGNSICYCALGGKTGTGLTQAFAERFRENHDPNRIKFITTQPPSFRLWISADNVEEYQKKLSAGETIIRLSQEAVLYLTRSFQQRSLPFTDLYSEIPKEHHALAMYEMGDWWVKKTIKDFLSPCIF
jgi:hypothetical protein